MGKFEQNLEQGKAGESIISRWLQARGHAVFPAYEKVDNDYKGPQLYSQSGDLVLPDLLAFKGGKAIWFEAKHKTCFTWYRIGQRWTTGIDLHHYGQYQEVAARTELPVWLMFYHPKESPDQRDLAFGCPPKCPTGLFAREISELAENESHRSMRHGKSGMVYWADTALKRIASAA